MTDQDYQTKRRQLLNICSLALYDIDSQIQCDCLNALDTQSQAFAKYTSALEKYNTDFAKWQDFDTKYSALSAQYNNRAKELNEYRNTMSYNATSTNTSRYCDYKDPNWEETKRDGNLTQGAVWCKYKQRYIDDQLAIWRRDNNLPFAVYKPPTVAPFEPGIVMCCQESMKNISSTGSVDFNNIRQNCQAEISQNISSNSSDILSPPSTQPPFSPPSTTPPSTPQSTDSTTFWIVFGIGVGLVGLFLLIGWWRSRNVETNVGTNEVRDIEMT